MHAKLALAIGLALSSMPVLADEPINTGFFGGVAIKGYDPVAYFNENRAVRGSEAFSYDWLGSPWQFSSANNQKLFQSNPVKYAPQFGGYCAGEVAFGGASFNIDPEAFTIIDGKLYMFSDKMGRDDFVKNVDTFMPKAIESWPKIKCELEQAKYH
jgi:YHS domain-containing protein